MSSTSSLLLFIPALLLASSVKIEQREVALWPTGNALRFRQPDSTPKGRPVWVDTELPAKFNPDSLRVLSDGGVIAIPAKVEWRPPKARISWLSTGASGYTVYFDLGNGGETHRGPEPALIGARGRVTHARPRARGKLAVRRGRHAAALHFPFPRAAHP